MNNQEEIKMINRQIIISNIFVWLGVILVCLSFSYMVYIIWSNNYGSQFETLFSAITGFITILSFFVLFLQNNSKLKLDLQVLTASTEELPAFTQNQLDELEKIFDNVIEKKEINQINEQIIRNLIDELNEIKHSQSKMDEALEKILTNQIF